MENCLKIVGKLVRDCENCWKTVGPVMSGAPTTSSSISTSVVAFPVLPVGLVSMKGLCNPTRLLEAAELLEADQRKQRKREGGQSKETSSVLDCTSLGSVLGSAWFRLGSISVHRTLSSKEELEPEPMSQD